MGISNKIVPRVNSWLLLLAVLSLTTCQQDKRVKEEVLQDNTSKNYVAQLVPNNFVIFKIDEKTSLFNPNIQYFEDAEKHPYFVVNNRVSNRLIFFDFITKKIAFEVMYEKNGVHGIGELRGATVLSLDSIIVLGLGSNIYLSDTTGLVKKKYKLMSKISNERVPLIQYGIPNSCFIPSSKDIFMFSTPYGVGRDKDALKKPSVIKYNLEEESWDFIDFSYPEVYFKDGYFSGTHFWGSIDKNKDKLIINFPASNYLHVYENGKLTKHLAKSDEISSITPPGKKMATTVKEIHTRMLQSPSYFFINYDSYRKVYYRFLLNTQDDLSSVGDILKMYDEKPCTIIILDEEFNKIGETDLAENTYHIPDHFIAPEGLYISTNHSDNPSLDEDKLSYQLLKLEYDK